mgnify:FL=1
MKKILFLLILLPTFIFSQENIKMSSENFLTEYYKLFEEKKWDVIPSMYTDDANMIWYNGVSMPMNEWIQPVLESYKTDTSDVKMDVKWVITDVIDDHSVMITNNYIESTKRSDNIRVTDNKCIYLLIKKDGSWKIKTWIPIQNYPLVYDDNVDKKYQTDNMSVLAKATRGINQAWSLIYYNIEHNKGHGILPDESGKMIGARFAKTWDKSKGFEGLASGIITELQIMTSYVEVIERNEYACKVKILPPTIYKTWNFTKNDLFTSTNGYFSEIAKYMGAESDLIEDGRYWVLTMTKKPE